MEKHGNNFYAVICNQLITMIYFHCFHSASVLKNIITKFKIPVKEPADQNTAQENELDARMKLLQKYGRRSQNGIEFELSRFANIDVQEPNVLAFWNAEKHNFPTMAAVANVLLGKPATSAASESAFSVAGALISSRRSSLDPLRARKILFIHDNYDLLHERD